MELSFQLPAAMFVLRAMKRELSMRPCFGCLSCICYCADFITPILPSRKLIREKKLSKAVMCRLQTFTTRKVPGAGRFFKEKNAYI